jgi:hypothetical protein
LVAKVLFGESFAILQKLILKKKKKLSTTTTTTNIVSSV